MGYILPLNRIQYNDYHVRQLHEKNIAYMKKPFRIQEINHYDNWNKEKMLFYNQKVIEQKTADSQTANFIDIKV